MDLIKIIKLQILIIHSNTRHFSKWSGQRYEQLSSFAAFSVVLSSNNFSFSYHIKHILWIIPYQKQYKILFALLTIADFSSL